MAAAFEQFISLNRSLEELNLNDCKLGPDGALVLGKSLRRNQRLQKLHLNQNRLCDKGLLAIADGILDNVWTTSQMQGVLIQAPITELEISKNDIELKDLETRATLCKLLSEPYSKLQALSMRDNLIRDEAAEALGSALKSNLSIMKLQMDLNPIKIDVLNELYFSVKRNVASHKEK